MYRLQEIVDRILSSKTTGALLEEMRKELRLVGVDYFCLVRYGQAGERVDQWVIGQRASQKWLDLYQYKDDPSADPVLMHCREVIEPFWWHEALPDDRLKRAKSLGLPPAALVVPVPSPYGIVGVEWMAGDCRDELSKHKIVIQAIGLACYYGLERLLGPPPPRPVTLTQREIGVFRLLTEGLSAPAIGKKLYISDRTVEWHIDKAMKKLGARNRIQAVVLAIRDGLIAPHQ